MKTYTPEEQAANRKLWIAALRSGKYEQGKYRLRVNDKFCCLGVACDILGIESSKGHYGTYVYGFNKSILPSIAANALGISNTGKFSNENLSDISICLHHLNDIQNMNFIEIADFIEQNEDKLTSFYNK